jgi:hypothetical protein
LSPSSSYDFERNIEIPVGKKNKKAPNPPNEIRRKDLII